MVGTKTLSHRHILFVKVSEMIEKLNVTEVPFDQLDVLDRAANQIAERYDRDPKSGGVPDVYQNRYNSVACCPSLLDETSVEPQPKVR